MKGSGLGRVKCPFISQVAELLPRAPLTSMPYCTPPPEPTLCKDYSFSIGEVLKSTSWEENGFIYALLVIGTRREEPFQFPRQSYSGVKRARITSTKVLEYEPGPQALPSAEERKWKIVLLLL